MAKTIRNRVTKEVRRVSDEEAEALVKKHGYEYIGKYEGRRLLASAQVQLKSA